MNILIRYFPFGLCLPFGLLSLFFSWLLLSCDELRQWPSSNWRRWSYKVNIAIRCRDEANKANADPSPAAPSSHGSGSALPSRFFHHYFLFLGDEIMALGAWGVLVWMTDKGLWLGSFLNGYLLNGRTRWQNMGWGGGWWLVRFQSSPTGERRNSESIGS